MHHQPSTANRSDESGFMTIFMTVILAFLFVVGLSLLAYVLTTKKIGKQVGGEVLSVQIAEAGVQKAMFCLNTTNGAQCGGHYGINYMGESTVDIGTGYFSTVLTGDGVNRTITAVGTTYDGFSQTVAVGITTVPPTDDTQFAYALQSGEGGAHLENNAIISGTLYSNGNVTCQTPQAIVDGDIYVSLAGGRVEDCKSNYHVHADRILDTVVKGNAYFKINPTDIAGSTVTGSKNPNSSTPEIKNLPSINLDFWRQSAEDGGVIYGNYSPTDNSNLGPIKIIGNLVMGNNIDVTVQGPIWVAGNITTGNNSTFTLDSTYDDYSTVILADNPSDQANSGKIIISNNTGIYGSGDPKSHLMFVSTNSSANPSAPSLSVSNNSTGAIFYATQGILRLQNNAGAKSLASHRLYVSQNAIVNYVESELADANFSNSPSNRWRIKPGEWRQVK
ncbi:MAG: hypothetical protein V1738_01675 [Patescibacteria group bacterium]